MQLINTPYASFLQIKHQNLDCFFCLTKFKYYYFINFLAAIIALMPAYPAAVSKGYKPVIR
jgi:hypothetical protein